MTVPHLYEVVPSLALAIALASCTGLRAWLPLLFTGALSRAGWIELGESYRFLGSNQALVLFTAATVIEIAADKMPTVDHLLDAFSTVLRPAAGSLLAASVFWRVSDPLTALALGVAVGAPSSLVPHAAKSAVRAVSTAFTAGLANPVLSLLEDAITLGLLVLAVLVAPLVVAAMGVLAFLALRRLVRAHPRPPVPAA